MADFSVQHHGNIVLLIPTSNAGHKWLKDHVDPDQAMRWGQCSIAVEPRLIFPLVESITADGLSTG